MFCSNLDHSDPYVVKADAKEISENIVRIESDDISTNNLHYFKPHLKKSMYKKKRTRTDELQGTFRT